MNLASNESRPFSFITKRLAISYILPVAVFLLARLPSILVIPIFNDESVYIAHALFFPHEFIYSLRDGRMIHELILAVWIRLFSFDPLLSARMFSVVSGLGVMLGIFLIAREMEQPFAGWLANLLYASAPMSVLHEHLALHDSLLTCVGCFVLLVSLKFARQERPTLCQARLLGLLIGIAAWVKLSGVFLLIMPVMAVLLLTDRTEMRQRLLMLRQTLILTLLCIVILAPFHYGSTQQVKMRFSNLGERIGLLGSYAWYFMVWVLTYLPASLLVPLILLAFLQKSLDLNLRIILWLLSGSLIFFIAFLVLGTTIYPRYLMPAWPALLLVCALAFHEIWKKGGRFQWAVRSVGTLALLSALVWNGYFSVQLTDDLLFAPLTTIDRTQYLETWTAGYHIPEIINLLKQDAQEQGDIIIANNDVDRLIHIAPKIYLYDDPRITFATVDLTSPNAPQQLQELATQRPTYVVLDEEEYQAYQFIQRFDTAHLQQEYMNPLRTMKFYVFSITP